MEVDIVIENQPHAAQQAVLDSPARFRILMCGRRFGKSVVAKMEALTTCCNGHRVAYITPTYLLARTFYSELDKVLPDTVYRNASALIFEFNGGQIRFFTGENLDRMRGLAFHLAIMDEASFIPALEDGWLNAIRPTLTDYKGKAIFLSTPKGKNYFYSLYLKGAGGDADWASFKFTTYDNPHIDPSEIDAARSMVPEVAFRQEYLADPSENSANPFGLQMIRQCTFPMSERAPVAFGIDLAKAVDWTVIVGLDDAGNVCYLDRFQRDWRQTREAILRLPNVPTAIDSTGVGDPIFEDIAREGRNVVGYKFSAPSKQVLMDGLMSAIHQRKMTFPEGIITRELEIFEYTYTSSGVRYSAPSGFTDDAVMALGLAWWCREQNKSAGRYSFV
jgi:hypothetical protein